MLGPLNKTLSAEGVYGIIDYKFYPWGNGYVNTTKCGGKSYEKVRATAGRITRARC